MCYTDWHKKRRPAPPFLSFPIRNLSANQSNISWIFQQLRWIEVPPPLALCNFPYCCALFIPVLSINNTAKQVVKCFSVCNACAVHHHLKLVLSLLIIVHLINVLPRRSSAGRSIDPATSRIHRPGKKEEQVINTEHIRHTILMLQRSQCIPLPRQSYR